MADQDPLPPDSAKHILTTLDTDLSPTAMLKQLTGEPVGLDLEKPIEKLFEMLRTALHSRSAYKNEAAAFFKEEQRLRHLIDQERAASAELRERLADITQAIEHLRQVAANPRPPASPTQLFAKCEGCGTTHRGSTEHANLALCCEKALTYHAAT